MWLLMLCQEKSSKYQTAAEMEMAKCSYVEKFGLWKWLVAALHKMVSSGSVCVCVRARACGVRVCGSVTAGKMENVIRLDYIRTGCVLQ